MDDDDEDDEDIDEDEVINVAERIFLRVAAQIEKLQVRSVRDVFVDQIFTTEFDGQVIELLDPVGFLKSIEALGIDDITE